MKEANEGKRNTHSTTTYILFFLDLQTTPLIQVKATEAFRCSDVINRYKIDFEEYPSACLQMLNMLNKALYIYNMGYGYGLCSLLNSVSFNLM